MYGLAEPGLGKVASMAPRRHAVSGANTSSENSVSMDGSNSDDEQGGSETVSSVFMDTPEEQNEYLGPRKITNLKIALN